MKKTQSIFVLGQNGYDLIYGPEEREDIQARVNMVADPLMTDDAVRTADLDNVEAIFSGWGGPHIDEAFLKRAPNLKVVFYGAGSIKGIVSEAFWKAGCRISSAYAMNAIPVTEYTVAQIILSLKHAFRMARTMREDRGGKRKHTPPGAYRRTVGLISLGMIGRKVCKLLKSYDLDVVAYDPFTTPKEAAEIGVTLLSLDDVFCQADVVSLHTPWLQETEGMITGAHFELMKEGATFINTARGAVVNEPEMISVFQKRSDLFALLDVTWPEPPAQNSPLYTLPNVFLTPHIAGSMGHECHRMGRLMVDELDRYLAGELMEWEITEETAARLA